MTNPLPFVDRLQARDAWWLAGVVATAAAYLWWLGQLGGLPAEDAAMLLRYARHLADGHGIVWNIGEPPVDGATDFLFMVAVAGLIKAGLSAELAARALTLSAWFGLLALVFLGARLLFSAPRWTAALLSAFLLTGPGLNYIEALFGTTVFGLWAGLTWFLAMVSVRRGGRLDAWAFAASGLVLGLIRPEGVFLAAFMLVAIVILSPQRAASHVLAFGVVFALAGGAYFAWHWSYFGFPLPNPFYRKSRELSLEGLRMPVRSALILLNALLLAFLPAFWKPASRRYALAVAVPVLGFTSLWVLLSNDTNYRGRFQFALVPIMLLAWPGLIRGWARGANGATSPSPARAALAGALLAAAVIGQAVVYRAVRPTTADGRYEVAMRLSTLADRGYVLATSEAGLLPLYSRWKSIDTWGLNDTVIAHTKELTPEYLERYQPHLIVFHAGFDPAYRAEQPPKDGWEEMCLILRDYAVTHGYRLAALWGRSRDDFHYYYVRPDFDESERVAEFVATGPYAWWLDGTPAINYAPPAARAHH